MSAGEMEIVVQLSFQYINSQGVVQEITQDHEKRREHYGGKSHMYTRGTVST